MKKVTIVLLGILSLPAYGGIASTNYVSESFKSIQDSVSSKANSTGYGNNSLLQTDNNGKLTSGQLKTGMISTGAVTNSRLASGLGLDKLDMGTLPTSGSHILIWNAETNKYVFEEYAMGSTPIDWAAISAYIGNYESNPDYTFASYGFAVDPDDYGYANYCEGSAGWDADMENQLYFGANYGGSCSDPEFAGMTPGDWYWNLPSPINVKIEGRALCSSTRPSTGVVGDPDGSGSGDTIYCWCRITSPAESRWVFYGDDGNADDCANGCADICAYYVQDSSAFRSALFGSIE